VVEPVPPAGTVNVNGSVARAVIAPAFPDAFPRIVPVEELKAGANMVKLLLYFPNANQAGSPYPVFDTELVVQGVICA
jgi:hypothetical protein